MLQVLQQARSLMEQIQAAPHARKPQLPVKGRQASLLFIEGALHVLTRSERVSACADILCTAVLQVLQRAWQQACPLTGQPWRRVRQKTYSGM